VDLATAERLSSAADPKGLSALKKQSDDPAVAKTVAGQFGALLMQSVMQGSDGAAIAMAGNGIGGNIVSALFANTISQAAMSGDKLGLADMLFRSIEAKQHAATGAEDRAPGAVPQAPTPQTAAPLAHASADGFALAPYWQDSGLRPLARVRLSPAAPATGRAGSVRSNAGLPPTYGWTPSPSVASEAPSAAKTAPAQVQSFIQQLRPLLVEAGRQLGVSPRILLAHAALETGWGHSMVGNNLFGVKAGPSWQGAQVTTMTQEMEGGQMVPRQASFRAYPSLDAAVQDYVALIGNSSRYQSLIGLGDDAAAYGRGLVTGGYATDTDYARKLETVAAGPSVTAAFTAPSQPGPLRLFGTQG
jgi:flagellar protein FlgJ